MDSLPMGLSGAEDFDLKGPSVAVGHQLAFWKWKEHCKDENIS